METQFFFKKRPFNYWHSARTGADLEVFSTMRDVNRVILLGRLGADPVERHTKTGLSVTNFSLATSRKITPNSGENLKEGAEKQEETVWHRIVAWGKNAELTAKYLRKGNSIYLEGYLRGTQYTSRDGTERHGWEVVCDRVHFLGGNRSRSKFDSGPDAEFSPLETELAEEDVA